MPSPTSYTLCWYTGKDSLGNQLRSQGINDLKSIKQFEISDGRSVQNSLTHTQFYIPLIVNYACYIYSISVFQFITVFIAVQVQLLNQGKRSYISSRRTQRQATQQGGRYTRRLSRRIIVEDSLQFISISYIIGKSHKIDDNSAVEQYKQH